MIATLGSYDRMFGPRHLTTLSLAAHIAEVLRGLGQPQTARSLLERVVRDLRQSAGRTHATRIAALRALKDLLVQQSDIAGAIAIQTEISECWMLVAGPGAPETIAAASELGELLMCCSCISSL
jgi:fructose-1,6-bisphosphatase/sedoheptulose 1,7-bisphosphatase-like protein